MATACIARSAAGCTSHQRRQQQLRRRKFRQPASHTQRAVQQQSAAAAGSGGRRTGRCSAAPRSSSTWTGWRCPALAMSAHTELQPLSGSRCKSPLSRAALNGKAQHTVVLQEDAHGQLVAACSPVLCFLSLAPAEQNMGCPPCKVVMGRQLIAFLKAALSCRRAEEGVCGGPRSARLAAALCYLAVQTPQHHPHHRSAAPWVPPALTRDKGQRQANDKVHHVTARAQLQTRKVAQGLLRSCLKCPSGGWYFEFPSGGREHPASLPPTAMVLRAAFETLEVRA